MATRRKRVTAKPPAVVEGVRMDKVDEDLVRQAYRDAMKAHASMAEPPMELPDEGDLDLEGLVKNLVLWFRVASPAEELCDCTTCGGDSDARLDACPFCGDAETGTEEAPGDPEEAPEVDDAGEPQEDDEPPVEPEPEPEERQVGKRKPRPAKNLPAPPGGSKAPKPAPRPKGQKLAKVQGEGEPLAYEAEVVDKGALLVEDLDASIQRVDQLKRTAASGIWELGQEIKRLLETKLWRLRTDAAGKAQYKTFAQFVKSELDMSYTHANRLMQVASNFSKETMERIGVAKCSIVLSLPPEARTQLLEGADNKSASQLSDEAKQLRDGEAPKPPRGALTVAMAPGVIEIPLMARPKNNRSTKGSDKPAKSLTDDPWGLEQLPNRVHCYYAVVKNKEGNLVLRVERRRVDSEEMFHDEEEGDVEE